MKHWSAEFQPRSLCSFAGPGGDGDSGGEPSGDTGGGYTGDTGGDFFGSSDGGFYGTNDSGSFVGGDTGFQGTGGDSWTGSESGASQFASSDGGGGFFGGDTGGDTGGGGGFIGGGDTGGGGFNYSGSDGGFIGPNSDFGYSPGDSWGPTGGVDYAGSGGFGFGPSSAGNLGFGNAIGQPGWATSDFGTYGTGGSSNTGLGPGAGPSIGGPNAYAQAPGINGFPGDFGAPPGGAFGMPNTQDVGPQAGPGMLGGPQTTQQGEALNPSLFGPEVTTPDRVADPNDRTEVDPSTVFGPAVTAQAGWFGPSQAQAGQNMTNQGVIDAANMANAFARTGDDMTAYMAATNPGLAQALNNAAMQMSAAPLVGPGQVGPNMTGFEQATPGAQQGFQTGGGPFGGTQGAFSGQPSLGNEQAQGKGDYLNPSGRADVQQTNPNFDQIGPMVTQQGYQQLAAEMNAQLPQTPTVQGQQSGVPTVDPATMQQGYQQLAAEMNARQAEQQATPQQIQQGYQTLADQMTQLATDFGPNYGPQAPGLAQPGQLGPEMGMTNPTVTPGQQQFGDAIPGTQFAAPSRGSDQAPPWMEGERGPIEQQMETIGLRPGEDVISSLFPATLGVGREAAPLGLWSMQNEPAGRPGGSPTGNPSQAGFGPFGPGGGRPGGDTSGRPGLSITVGGNQQASGRPGGGYYQTGGAGIAPGAKGAEYGGAYGVNSPGRPGSGAFGGDFRQGGGGGAYFYDPATGQYFVR